MKPPSFLAKPYRIRTWFRRRSPWFLINLGFAKKGADCVKLNGMHEWYSKDLNQSACYHCRVEREGRLWEAKPAKSKGV
jgi:hypothetical protein